MNGVCFETFLDFKWSGSLFCNDFSGWLWFFGQILLFWHCNMYIDEVPTDVQACCDRILIEASLISQSSDCELFAEIWITAICLINMAFFFFSCNQNGIERIRFWISVKYSSDLGFRSLWTILCDPVLVLCERVCAVVCICMELISIFFCKIFLHKKLNFKKIMKVLTS